MTEKRLRQRDFGELGTMDDAGFERHNQKAAGAMHGTINATTGDDPHAALQAQQQSREEADLQALIGLCVEGDEAAFSDFYGAASPGVYRLAYSILLHRQDAEDVVQESMVYAFRNLHRYDPTRGAVRTWLYTITVSRCRNARRRKWLPQTALSHLLTLGVEPPAPAGEAPEAAIARMGVRDTLEKALTGLTPRLREAIALRYGQGLTYREMADILDCPQKTAESRVRLAHEALRAALHAPEAALVEELWSFA